MAANITSVKDGRAIVRLPDQTARVIRPAEGCVPWWIDADGNYYHPTDFTWELP